MTTPRITEKDMDARISRVGHRCGESAAEAVAKCRHDLYQALKADPMIDPANIEKALFFFAMANGTMSTAIQDQFSDTSGLHITRALAACFRQQAKIMAAGIQEVTDELEHFGFTEPGARDVGPEIL